MKKTYISTLALIAVACVVPAQTGGDQSYLGIFAETTSTRMIGMKMRQMPKLPPGFKLPPAAKAFMGGNTRLLTVRLWSPSIAPDNATATLVPPAGLQQGDKLDLELFRPTPPTPSNGGAQGNGSPSQENQDFTIKVYWGSSDNVQPGQPKIFTFSTLTTAQKMEMGKNMRAVNPNAMGGNYFYKDGWTTGYWPTQVQPGDISDSASMVGTFTLNTSYTGNVSIDDPSNVDFLAPIEMTSPDLSQKPNMANALPFQWNAIPNALGEFATMFGMEGKNTMILWSSSQVYMEQVMADMGYLQMSEVNDMVQKTVFMPGSTTSATVPAGIFQNCDFAMFNIVGYGPGTAKDSVQPSPRIQTKTTLKIMFPMKHSNGGGGGSDGGGRRN